MTGRVCARRSSGTSHCTQKNYRSRHCWRYQPIPTPASARQALCTLAGAPDARRPPGGGGVEIDQNPRGSVHVMSFSQSLLFILALVLASAFFSLAEISLAASRRLRLRQLADEGDARALQVLRVQEQPGYYFTTVQIGVNAIAILGGIVGEGAIPAADLHDAHPTSALRTPAAQDLQPSTTAPRKRTFFLLACTPVCAPLGPAPALRRFLGSPCNPLDSLSREIHPWLLRRKLLQQRLHPPSAHPTPRS